MAINTVNLSQLHLSEHIRYAEVALEWQRVALESIRSLSDQSKMTADHGSEQIFKNLLTLKELCPLISQDLRVMGAHPDRREAIVCLDQDQNCQGMMVVNEDESMLEIVHLLTNPRNLVSSSGGIRGVGTLLIMEVFQRAVVATKPVHVFSTDNSKQFYENRGFTIEGLGGGVISSEDIQDFYPEFFSRQPLNSEDSPCIQAEIK